MVLAWSGGTDIAILVISAAGLIVWYFHAKRRDLAYVVGETELRRQRALARRIALRGRMLLLLQMARALDDWDAVHRDFAAVGLDMRRALAKYARNARARAA